MRIFRSRFVRRFRVRSGRSRGGSSRFFKRFASVEGLELRAMLSGSSLLSESAWYSTANDDVFASPLSQLSMVSMLASTLGQRDSSAPASNSAAPTSDGEPEAAPLAATSSDDSGDEPIAEPLIDGITVNVFLRAEDLEGNEITSIGVGQDFRLLVFVDDIRMESEIPNTFGVFSGAVRVTFDSDLVSLEDPDSLEVDPFFPLSAQTDSSPGEIRGGGGANQIGGPGSDPQLLWSVTLRASAGGTVDFNSFFDEFSDSAFPLEWLVFGDDDQLTIDNVSFQSLELDVVGISIGDVTHQETESAQNYVFTVSLSAPAEQQVTVAYTTQNGTATAGSDYTATSGTLTFDPGDTEQFVTVQVLGDLLVEADETFTVVLSNSSDPEAAPIVDDTGLGTIEDNDVPRVGITGVSQDEGDSDNTMVFTVTLSDASAADVVVAYSTQNGTAVADSDYTATSGTLTFVAGNNSPQFVTVNILGDDDPEQNETFQVELSGLSGAIFDESNGEATGTLLNDDGPRIDFVQQSFSQSEDQTEFVFAITVLDKGEDDVTVAFTTANGTAAGGSDYTPTSGTLTFSGETTTQSVTVIVNNDSLPEADETFRLLLSDPQNATLVHDTATATILDDDGPPALSFESDTESATEGTAIVFTVNLSSASGETVTVEFATQNVSAMAGSDYTGTSGTLTFDPGDTQQFVTVNVTSDALNELDETFQLRLFNAQNTDNTEELLATGTIDNDDPVPTLTVSPVETNEGTGATPTNFVFAAELDAPSGQLITVVWSTANGTATAGSDYTATSGTLTFEPGDTTQSITVAVTADSIAESNETFTINLSSPQNVDLEATSVTGTIVNDDGLPTISITAPSPQNEGNEGNTPFVFTVTLSNQSDAPVTVAYTTVNQTASTADNDYTATSGTLTFMPGDDLSQTITVLVIGDDVRESNETFSVQLSSPSGATIATGAASATIVDDDPLPTLSISDVTQAEGNSGTTPFVFTVALAGTTQETVTVAYSTTNGTAGSNDFTATSGTLTFTAGTTVQMITVLVNGDNLQEPNETFSVLLASPTGATIADGTGIGTIQSEATDSEVILPSTISGTVYADSNGNGAKNGNEKAHAGSLVVLTGTDASAGAVSMQTTTGPGGTYSFNNLGPGTYTIIFDQPSQYHTGHVALGNTGGEILSADLGFTFTIDEPGGVAATGYDFLTGSLQSQFISQRLFIASNLANNGNPPASEVAVSISSVTNPINAGNATSTTISGSGTAGALISVVASGSGSSTAAQTTTVAANGSWSIAGVNVSALADGTITYLVTATGSGGTTATATRTATKDTVAPSVAITSVTDPINSTNASDTSISGTGTAGAAISVVYSAGGVTSNPFTTSVASDGTWNIDGIDVTLLPDGDITYMVTATDTAQNTATTSIVANKDTVAPAVAVTVIAPDPINAENEDNVTISGTGTPGAGISVIVSDSSTSTSAFTTTVAGDGSWSIAGVNVSTLADGTLTFNVTATDTANNTASTSATAEKDTVAPEVSIDDVTETINTENVDAFDVGGTGVAGTQVTVVANVGEDATEAMMVTVDNDGNWTATLDLSDLPDGTVTFTVSATDTAGNTGTDSTTATKDTEVLVEIDEVTSPIGIGNYQTTSINGTGDVGATVEVVVSDGDNSTEPMSVVVGAGGTWLIENIDTSSLADGTLTYNVTITDTAGNTATDSITSEKATLVIDGVIDPINAAAVEDVTITGTGEIGATVVVVATDENENSVQGNAVIDGDGNWSVTLDLSDLNDGTITFDVTATDDDENEIEKSITAEMDTEAPSVVITNVPNPINAATAAAVTVSGTGEVGTEVSVVADDGVTPTDPIVAAVDSEGNWFVVINVSGLAEGPITFTATSEDAVGNVGTDTSLATKDTEAEVIILDVTDPVGIGEYLTTSINGTGDAGASVELVVSDGVNSTEPVSITVDVSGNWVFENVDTSSLADGTLTYTVTLTDTAGNGAVDTITSEKATLEVLSFTTPINAASADEVTVSGTGEVGAEVLVVATDENENTVEGNAVIAGDGTWSVTFDLSGLIDGLVSFDVTATDGDTNEITKSFTELKDTEAPNVEITSVPEVINAEGAAAVTVSGTGEVGAAISVIADDGVTMTDAATTTVDGDGNWSVTINVVTLADNTITFTATATDASGNSADDVDTSEKDTQTEVDIDEVTDPIDIGNYLTTSINGTGEAGATVEVVVSDGSNSTEPAAVEVDGDGNWLIENIDTSMLVDGTLTYTVTITDLAGNTAVDTITAEKATLEVLSVTDPINAESADAVTVSGTGEVGAEVVVVATDENEDTVEGNAVIDVNGNWSVTLNLSGLIDGSIEFVVTATDVDDNEISKSFTAFKDTELPAVAINPATTINGETAAAVTFSGTAEPNTEVELVVTDENDTPTATYNATVGGDGTWLISGVDTSGLEDGTLTITVTATDASGNSNQATGEVDLDTEVPQFDITTVTDPIDAGNETSTAIEGTGEVDATIEVFASDGVMSTITFATAIDGDGNWSISGIDVSGLADGTITYIVTATDAAGNSQTKQMTAEKDAEAEPLLAEGGEDDDDATDVVDEALAGEDDWLL